MESVILLEKSPLCEKYGLMLRKKNITYKFWVHIRKIIFLSLFLQFRAKVPLCFVE